MNKNFNELYSNDKFIDNKLVDHPTISNDKLIEGYEKSELYDIDLIKNNFKLYDYNSLKEEDVCGSLLLNYYEENKLKQAFLPKSHKIILGTTGSGKTQSYILPYIKSVTSFKKPHSLVISDLKGELYSLTADDLKRKGYKVICLNLKNALYSEMWNPFVKIYDCILEKKNLFNKIKTKNSIPKNDVKSFIGFNDISKRQKWYLYNNVGYKEKKLAIEIAKQDEEQLQMKISKLVSTISYGIIKTESHDPYWDNCAREALEGAIHRFIELIEEGALTREQFNFKNIIEVLTTYSEYELDDFFDDSSVNSASSKFAKKILKLPPNTKGCVLSTLSTKLSQYKTYNIQRATIDNTIDLSSFDKEATALYIIMDDMDKTSYELVKLLITFLYEELDNIANEKEEKILSRPFEFILDEFCNIPPIENFSNMISTSRSKDIWFTMVIQSYAQLETKYGRDVKETILNNSNMEVFFGTNDYETRELFSRKCGRNTRLACTSYYNGSGENITNYQKEEYQLVPVSDLSLIKEDTCYIRFLNYPIFKTVLTRFYKVKEYQTPLSNTKELYKTILMNDKKYIFSFFEYKEKKDEERRKKALEKRNQQKSTYKSVFSGIDEEFEDDEYSDVEDEELKSIKEFLESLNEEDDD